MILYPTYHCFDDALEFIGERVTRDPDLAHGTTLLLVHAIVLGPREAGAVPGVEVVAPDQPFAHAWVEEAIGREVVAWISGLTAAGARVFVMIPRDTYRATMRVQQATAYTCREAWKANKRSGHYGPWREAYRVLCRNKSTTST